MCYVIEFIDDFVTEQKFKITTEALPDTEVRELNAWITSQFDYVGIAVTQWDEHRPFKINVPFGKDQIPNIRSQYYELSPKKCKKTDPDYQSVQQCNVDFFLSNEFPCPYKVERQFNFHCLNSKFTFVTCIFLVSSCDENISLYPPPCFLNIQYFNDEIKVLFVNIIIHSYDQFIFQSFQILTRNKKVFL